MSKALSKALARVRIRLRLRKDAMDQYHEAQRQLELARGADLHPRQHLVNAVQEALAKVKLRNSQVHEAQAQVKNLKAKKPKRPRVDVTRLGNCSSRNGVKPRLIVLHITVSHNRPGRGDVDAILNFFQQPSSQASSHIVIDAEGLTGRCVMDRDKAWTQAAFNPQSLSIEQVEFAAKPREQWMAENKPQLEQAARWVAWWGHKYDIPLVKSTFRGVCEHSDLGPAGGGHSDCGPGYPLQWVIDRAKEIQAEWA